MPAPRPRGPEAAADHPRTFLRVAAQAAAHTLSWAKGLAAEESVDEHMAAIKRAHDELCEAHLS